jgi:hypothetical protein
MYLSWINCITSYSLRQSPAETLSVLVPFSSKHWRPVARGSFETCNKNCLLERRMQLFKLRLIYSQRVQHRRLPHGQQVRHQELLRQARIPRMVLGERRDVDARTSLFWRRDSSGYNHNHCCKYHCCKFNDLELLF